MQDDIRVPHVREYYWNTGGKGLVFYFGHNLHLVNVFAHSSEYVFCVVNKLHLVNLFVNPLSSWFVSPLASLCKDSLKITLG